MSTPAKVKYRGVYPLPNKGKRSQSTHRALISVLSKPFDLGTFLSDHEAALAFNLAQAELHPRKSPNPVPAGVVPPERVEEIITRVRERLEACEGFREKIQRAKEEEARLRTFYRSFRLEAWARLHKFTNDDLPLTLDKVRDRYRELARQYHPDVSSTPDPERFEYLTQAWDLAQHHFKRHKLYPEIPNV